MRQHIRNLGNRLLSRPEVAKTRNDAADIDAAAVVLPPELDLDFYGNWYADLQSLDDAALARHWEQFGKNEGRAPSFNELLKAKGLDASALPRDFEGAVYLKLNPTLRVTGVTNAWAAALHYLTKGAAEKRDYRFDASFYTTYYRDLAGFAGEVLEHYIEHGKAEGRIKTSSEYWKQKGLNAVELESLIEVPAFLAQNPDLADTAEYLGTKWNIVDFLLSAGLSQVRAVSTEPKVSAQAYYYLGNALVGKGEREAAEQAYMAACSFDPAHAAAMQHLADMYLTANRHIEAVEFYRFALAASADPGKNFWANYNLAMALDALGDAQAALAYLEIARKADPNIHLAKDRHEAIVKREWEKFDVRAKSALKVGKKKEAEALYAQANALIDTLFEQFPVAPQPIGPQPRVALGVDP